MDGGGDGREEEGGRRERGEGGLGMGKRRGMERGKGLIPFLAMMAVGVRSAREKGRFDGRGGDGDVVVSAGIYALPAQG